MLDHVASTAADVIYEQENGGDTLNYNKPPADPQTDTLRSSTGAEHFMGQRAVRPLRAVKRISGREVILYSHCSSVSVAGGWLVCSVVIELSGG